MKHSKKIAFLTFSLVLFIFSNSSFASVKPEIFVQLGHSGTVNSIVFSNDGEMALSASSDRTIKLWNVQTGKELKTFTGHTGNVRALAIMPSGKQFLSASDDMTLNRWDIMSGREIRTYRGHKSTVFALAISRDGKMALSGSSDETLKLWNIQTGKDLRTFSGHADWVLSVAFSPDGKYALSGSHVKDSPKLWDLKTGKIVRSLPVHSQGVYAISYSPSGKYVLFAGGDGTLRLWDIINYKELKTITVTRNGVLRIASFFRNDKYAFSGGVDNTVTLWDLERGEAIKQLWHSDWVDTIAISKDAKYLLSGGENKLIKLWNIDSGKELKILKGQAGWVDAVSFSPDGKYAVSAGENKFIRLWDVNAGKGLRTFSGHSDRVYSVVFSRDGKLLLSGSYDKTMKLWNVQNGSEIMSFLGHTERILAVALTSNQKYAISASEDKTIKLWNVQTGKEVRTFTGHTSWIISLAVSPDDNYIASASGDGTIKLWDIRTGKELKTFSGHDGYVIGVAFSPDGKYIVSGGVDKKIMLWDINNGHFIRTLNGHSDRVRSVVFSPDGRYIISASEDRTLKLWDAQSGEEIRTLKGHFNEIRSLTFNNDGNYALSGSSDGTARLWDISDGKEIAQLISFTDGEWIIITPEGYFNASLNGAKHLNVRIGNSVFGIDQFYAKFYRPELVQLAITGKEMPKGESLGDILAKNPAPIIQIVSPLSGSSIDKDNVTVSLKIKDNGGGIGNVMIYLNGSQVANETRGLMVKGKLSANEKELSFTIPLIEGQNEIKAIAFNKENSMESNPASVYVISKAVLQKPNLYALVIGINEYKNKSISLNYAVPDAKAFANTLKKTAAPLFGKTDIRMLTTPEETTKEAITKVFEEIRLKIKSNDLFVFYNASHGIVDVVDGEEQYFLLTSNVLLLSSRHIGKDAMGQKELAKLIGSISAQKKVVILDTCNAGKGGREIQIALLQQTRGLTDSTAVKLLQRAIGSAVFSASSDTQMALEGYKGHGLFTYVLIEGLQGKADVKKDGYITVLGLADYVEEQVIKLSEEVFKRQQTPTIQTGANFPIGKVR